MPWGPKTVGKRWLKSWVLGQKDVRDGKFEGNISMMYGDVVGLKRWEEQIGNMVIAYVLQSLLWFCGSMWHCSCFACDN